MFVGLTGFEPAASPTLTECATGLRHNPNHSVFELQMFKNFEERTSTKEFKRSKIRMHDLES